VPNVVLLVVSYIFIIVVELIVAEGAMASSGLGLQQPKPFRMSSQWPVSKLCHGPNANLATAQHELPRVV
jgi:hypothetical protein